VPIVRHWKGDKMTVLEVIEQIKKIDEDIKGIEWAKTQINCHPKEIESNKAWKLLSDELIKLTNEKESIMNWYIAEPAKHKVLGG
jgi:hypothetical protein